MPVPLSSFTLHPSAFRLPLPLAASIRRSSDSTRRCASADSTITPPSPSPFGPRPAAFPSPSPSLSLTFMVSRVIVSASFPGGSPAQAQKRRAAAIVGAP